MAMTVGALMTPEPILVDAGTGVGECARLMERHDIGALGVIDGGRLVGVLTDRDIVLRLVAHDRDPKTSTAGDIATQQVVTMVAEDAVEEADKRMRERAVRRLFVVDAEERPVGILTADDLTAVRDPDSVVAAQIGEWGMVRGDGGL